MKNIKIGKKTKIDPSTKLIGKVVIGNNCKIGPNNVIKDSIIGDNSKIDSSYIEDSIIDSNCQIGPFSHIRDHSIIKSYCRIGNYVEIKKSVINQKVKCAHLSYIGDAEIGENTNIGCGVITANYNGITKEKTFIGKNCFIGCQSILVAPIRVEDGCYVAAGTVLTSSLKNDTFAIRRAELKLKEKNK